MATVIEQEPNHALTVGGSDIMFTVSNANVVASYPGVKFIAEVHISGQAIPNPVTIDDRVGIFKVNPNDRGVGIFNIRSVVEDYLGADHLTKVHPKLAITPSFKNYNRGQFPIHMVDKFSGNTNAMKFVVVVFKAQYRDNDPASGTYNQVLEVDTEVSRAFKIFNGYLTYNDMLDVGSNGRDYGFDLDKYQLTSSSSTFLTNRPKPVYANIEDYGTFGFISGNTVSQYNLFYYDSGNVQIGNESVKRINANGAPTVWTGDMGYRFNYIGIYPGNLRNWSATFRALVAAGTIDHYKVNVTGPTGTVGGLWTIYVNCPNDGDKIKGYEPVRLAWLNQWGAWDYYTFRLKSTITKNTSPTTYTQLEGTWNSDFYKIDGFRGGKKTFRVNTTEKITINTEYVNENHSPWFEELINSPDVYIIKSYNDDDIVDGSGDDPVLNNYVQPVRMVTKQITRKTVANDKLVQYTFEVEKSRTERTQTI
mgnify:CR=1 FL=1|tara:strand:- start:6323 stop:7756 length:1434 start_codon:yes stop_codon:yes gene_type:complete